MTEATKPATATKPAAESDTMLVLDTTAMPDTIDQQGRVVSGARVHEQLVDGRPRTFIFKNDEPLALPRAIALKFLRHDAFKLVDKDRNIIEFKRPPRQPEELGAGERIVLSPEETIARFDELASGALQTRVLALPGGEKFTGKPAREEMITFLVAYKASQAKSNVVNERDADGFVPEAESEEAA